MRVSKGKETGLFKSSLTYSRHFLPVIFQNSERGIADLYQDVKAFVSAIMKPFKLTFAMKKEIQLLVLFIFGSGMLLFSNAQVYDKDHRSREDDHYQRNLVVNRIDMTEKVNQPMVEAEDMSLYNYNKYGERNGLIAALMNGLESGKYLAYDPDSLNKTLTWNDVSFRLAKIGGNPYEPKDDIPDYDPEFPEDDDFFPDSDDLSFEPDPFEAEGDVDPDASMDFAALETVVEFIEHRIFDKNRSEQMRDIQYIRLVWVDPGETLPDQNFICLKYDDVLETLEDTQWKNRFNDAESRNMREIFELGLYHAFITNISGRGVRSLEESEYRRNQLLDFEHHLWSF